MNIPEFNTLSKAVYEANKEKGFNAKTRPTSTSLMLIVSELAEALEADRAGRFANPEAFKACKEADDILETDRAGYIKSSFKALMKDTFEDEIADTFIRLLDLCGGYEIDIEFHIKEKLKFNKTREQKHGKKY